MAQRNPMNDRNMGDGPAGQTRKSASSAKPAAKAASSVYIKKKPQTPAEKRAARKAREREDRLKAQAKAQKAAEKAKALAEAQSVSAAEGVGGDQDNVGADAQAPVKRGLFGKVKASADANAGAYAKTKQLGATSQAQRGAQSANTAVPSSEEYHKWRRVYWTLVVIGIICIILAFILQMNLGSVNPTLLMVVIGIAYPAIIGALIVDFRKVKPIVRAHQASFTTANKSPKQLKHEQEARDQAAALEASRKAAKAAKRVPKRKTQSLVPDEALQTDSSTLVPGQDSAGVDFGEDK